jgi:hypothetical protein
MHTSYVVSPGARLAKYSIIPVLILYRTAVSETAAIQNTVFSCIIQYYTVYYTCGQSLRNRRIGASFGLAPDFARHGSDVLDKAPAALCFNLLLTRKVAHAAPRSSGIPSPSKWLSLPQAGLGLFLLSS